MRTQSVEHRHHEAEFLANMTAAKERRDYILWAESVWKIKGDPDKPYRIKGAEYLIDILNNQAPKLVVQSAAQVLKSEGFAIMVMAEASWGSNTLHVFEVDGKAQQFVNERVNTNIKTSAYLTNLCADTDNVGQKKVGRGFAYYRGCSLSQATSVAADTLVLDEYDLMDKQIAAFYLKRLNHSKNPKERYLSNPQVAGAGINKMFLDGMQFYWHIVCDHCKHDAALKWHTHMRLDLRTYCPGCSRPIDRLKPGRWVAHNPNADYPSYLISGIMSPIFDPKKVMEGLNSPDPMIRRAAWVMDLGLPYEDKEAGLTPADIAAVASPNNSTKYAPGGFMAVDPGGVFDYQIFKKPEPGKPLECVYLGHASGFEELARIEAESEVEFGCIDHLPELDGARDWCEKRDGRWKRISYLMGSTGSERFRFTKSRHMLDCNRTLMCDWYVTNIRQKKILYPRDQALDPHSRLVEHLTALTRTTEKGKDGNYEVKWEHKESQPDHQFHCGVYALLCAEAVLSRFVETGVSDGDGSF